LLRPRRPGCRTRNPAGPRARKLARHSLALSQAGRTQTSLRPRRGAASKKFEHFLNNRDLKSPCQCSSRAAWHRRCGNRGLHLHWKRFVSSLTSARYLTGDRARGACTARAAGRPRPGRGNAHWQAVTHGPDSDRAVTFNGAIASFLFLPATGSVVLLICPAAKENRRGWSESESLSLSLVRAGPGRSRRRLSRD